MQIVFINESDIDDKYVFYLGTCSDENGTWYTDEYQREKDDWESAVDLAYDHCGADFAFQGLICSTNFTPPSDPTMAQIYNFYKDHVNDAYKNAKRFYRGQPYNNQIEDNVVLGFFENNKMYYLQGSDPDTRRYLKFTVVNNQEYCTVYEHDKNTIVFQDYGGVGCVDFNSWASSITKYMFTDISAFINAPNVGSARQFVKSCNISIANYGLTSMGIWAVYAVNKSGNVAAFDALYYLLQTGAEDVPENKDPYAGDDGPYDPSGPGGGGGNRPPYDEGDDIPYPDDPPVSICDTGLISLYTPDLVQLNLLAADIWSNNFVSSLVKDVYADPIDVIIDVGIVPFNVVPAGVRKIKVGERELDISSNYPESNYVNFDMGSVALEEALGAYTDFAPYTKGNIYIPYVGFCPLDVDYFMGHNIGLKYKVDLCTGSAVAYLMRDNSVHQQFACNLKIDIPLSGADYSGMWSTIIGATAALATAGAAGLAGATAASEAGGAVAFNDSAALKAGGKSASDIMTGMSTKPQIQKSNSMPNTGGLVGYPCAFIVLEHPALAIPTNQNKFIGYPSYINSKLSTLSGYTRVSAIHLGIPGATKSELLQIEGMLKNGVRIESGTAVTGNGVVLINNSSAENVIGKSMSLVASLTGAFRDEVDIVKPVVRIERASAVGFNYVYISDFGRYYYVEEVKAFRNNILELSLTCDPLESFKTQILNHDAIIDKQENQWNLYLNDDSIKMYQYPLIWRKLFDNAFWENFEYVLITAGH